MPTKPTVSKATGRTVKPFASTPRLDAATSNVGKFTEEAEAAYQRWLEEGDFYNPAKNMTPSQMSKQSPSGRAAGTSSPGSATSKLKKMGGLPLPPKV